MARVNNPSRMQALALAYATGSTIKAWSDANEISVNTCYTLTKTNEFKRLVAEYRSGLIDSCLGQLMKHAGDAAAQIAKLATSAETEAVKLSACKAVLESLIQYTNFASLTQHVESLKAEIEQLKGGHLAIRRPTA